MKNFLTFGILMFTSLTSAFAQGNSCCTKPSTVFQTFAMLVKSAKAFVSGHQSPLPYTHKSEVGKMITFKTPAGKTGHGYKILVVLKM